jgi:hypothetical protein
MACIEAKIYAKAFAVTCEGHFIAFAREGEVVSTDIRHAIIAH